MQNGLASYDRLRGDRGGQSGADAGVSALSVIKQLRLVGLFKGEGITRAAPRRYTGLLSRFMSLSRRLVMLNAPSAKTRQQLKSKFKSAWEAAEASRAKARLDQGLAPSAER